MTITDEQRRAEAQRRLLAEILGQAQAQAQAEKQRLLNAASQQQNQARQPLTDPAQRRAAQQRVIAQNLAPRTQAQPQRPVGMDSQSREFFERQRLLNAGAQQQTQTTAPPQFDPSADDRIARKLNAIVKRSDLEVTQNGYSIEIRQRGAARDAVIRAITGPRTVSSSTARYR